jgi:hypothetical protein
MLVHDDDAQPHQKTTGNDWRESYYCNFFDQRSDVCGVFWQGTRPNSGHGESVVLICDGAKDLVRSLDFKVPVPKDVPEDRRINGAARFTCVEPWKHWTVGYEKGEDRFLLDWRQMSDVCDWEWEDLTNSKHYQLAGKVRGSGKLGGRTLDFVGYGERDRAWGDRNYGPLKVSFWTVAQFPDDVAVHAFALLLPDGSYRLHGYLHKDNRTCGLARFEADTIYGGERGPPENGKIRYIDDAGRTLDIAAFERKNHIALGAAPTDGAQLGTETSKSQSLMFLTLQRFKRADGVVGNGMIDYNCWVGNQPAHIVATAPTLYSTLYRFGRS